MQGIPSPISGLKASSPGNRSMFTSSHPFGFNLDRTLQYFLLQERSIVPQYVLLRTDYLLQWGSVERWRPLSCTSILAPAPNSGSSVGLDSLAFV